MMHGKKAKQFILQRSLVRCHLQNAELEKKFQKNKGRVALRGDVVKDDSSSYAVFTELGILRVTHDVLDVPAKRGCFFSSV